MSASTLPTMIENGVILGLVEVNQLGGSRYEEFKQSNQNNTNSDIKSLLNRDRHSVHAAFGL